LRLVRAFMPGRRASWINEGALPEYLPQTRGGECPRPVDEMGVIDIQWLGWM
jgi:hypothetical protein